MSGNGMTTPKFELASSTEPQCLAAGRNILGRTVNRSSTLVIAVR